MSPAPQVNDPRFLAQEIMMEFGRLTGLSPAWEAPRRYLWTDAFAVCNLLGLYRQEGKDRYRRLALDLVDQVHNVLGRHREDDARKGWISGLDEEEGKAHPTRGGLRIGKTMTERRRTEPVDERLEWDRDGQYFHYLTKWMHALNCASQATGDLTYNGWAMELAKTAHERFLYMPFPGAQKRMYWKMSIDLSYPLVLSMGHHDPLDGLITYHRLRATAARGSGESTWLDLEAEIRDMAEICQGKNWVTDDPLGIGGLLSDAYRAAGLIELEACDPGLPATLLDASLVGLRAFSRGNLLTLPADWRLAFRELGLCIGLRAVEKLHDRIRENGDLQLNGHSLRSSVEALRGFEPLKRAIQEFWLDRRNWESETWKAHREINMVMLATSLAPEGFLDLI